MASPTPTTDRGDEPVSIGYHDLMQLVSRYGAARASQGLRTGMGDAVWADAARVESSTIYDLIVTQVYRLYRDRGEV